MSAAPPTELSSCNCFLDWVAATLNSDQNCQSDIDNTIDSDGSWNQGCEDITNEWVLSQQAIDDAFVACFKACFS